jgi:hypothetical protein
MLKQRVLWDEVPVCFITSSDSIFTVAATEHSFIFERETTQSEKGEHFTKLGVPQAWIIYQL